MTLQPLWACETLRRLDQVALKDLPWLMEVAGAGLADAVARAVAERGLRPGAQVELWVGPGDNGGDGLVACRHLLELGLRVAVWAPHGLPASGDAAEALAQLEPASASIQHLEAALHRDSELVVDCLFGTGLSRPLSDHLLESVERLNRSPLPVVACDIPSGLCGNTGRVLGAAVRADWTIAFGGLKPGFFCSDGFDYCGTVRLATLGYRPDHYDQVEPEGYLDLRPAQEFLPSMRQADHKGRFGRVLALAGSPGMEGAALLTLEGARCGGAGLLHLWSPERSRRAFGELPAEVMLAPFADHALEVAARCDVIVAGPGLGRTPAAREALLRLLGAAGHKPWILDADALYHLAHERFELPDQCLLTPHEGEALRLVGEDPLVGTWGGDRFSLAQQLSARFGVDVLLKGAGNIITLDGVSCLVPGSARGLARGGSGDVLSGLIAAVVGRGASLGDAAHFALRLQLMAAQSLDRGEAETVSQAQLVSAMTAAWREVYEAHR